MIGLMGGHIVSSKFLKLKGFKMYSAQKNRFGNIIVCKGFDVRNSYEIIFTGTYEECLLLKLKGV